MTNRYLSDSSQNSSDDIASGALMCIGSLMGGIGFYLWEAITLSRVLDAQANMDASGHSMNFSDREISFRNLAQSRVCLPGRKPLSVHSHAYHQSDMLNIQQPTSPGKFSVLCGWNLMMCALCR